MLGESAHAQGYDFLAFGDNPESSFANRFPEHFVLGDSKSQTDLFQFAKRCKVITLENEFFDAALLKLVEDSTHTRVIPSPTSYLHFETKLAQREFYAALGLSAPTWARAKNLPDQILTQLQNEFSYPVVLKASRGGYDGYGVRILKSADELSQALQDLNHSVENPVLIEEKVSIQKEFAQGALFDGKGGAVLLPLVETIQRNGICELVLSEPTLSLEELEFVRTQIEATLDVIAKSKIIGLYSFEFFYTDKKEILINEGAPRPHNSQHLSIDASPISQFDLLIQFLAKDALPEISSPISSKPGVMINLLGKSVGQNYKLALPKLPAGISAHPKLYLKKESKIGRKMGHLNLIVETGEHDLVELGETFLKEYTL
jgi:5-(carboxyamino)imidazole ribonucleotide synthase